jgi:DNA-binding MarR family transcriptional regulator
VPQIEGIIQRVHDPLVANATMLSVRGKHCDIGPPRGKSRPFSSLESLQAVSVSAKIFGARVDVERHAGLQQHAMTQEMAQRVPDAAERVALKLEEFLPYRLNVCSSLVSHALSRIYADRYKIGVPEWRVLVTLGQFGAMTAKAIGDHSHMHKTKVSRAVALLERRKLVTRRANRADLREAFLSLTAAGRDVYNELAPIALDFARELLESVDAADRAALDRALMKLTERSAQLAPSTGRIANGRRPG